MFGFGAVIISGPIDSALLFRIGTTVIGFGAGLFGVGTLTAAMARDNRERNGLAVGAWGSVQATCAGLSVALGGLLRDGLASLASSGRLGEAMRDPTVAYGVVYHLEILALFAALVIVGPLVAPYRTRLPTSATRFGLAELPG
jgi:BCD family chlorophyll transporter-like MFS transporter